MRRCMASVSPESSSTSRYLPRRPTDSTRRPSTRAANASGSSGLTSSGSATATRAIVRPGMRSASWRRMVSTSGSSGTAPPLRQHQRRRLGGLGGDPDAPGDHLARRAAPPPRRARAPPPAAPRPPPAAPALASSSMPATGSTDWSACRRPAPSQRAASPTPRASIGLHPAGPLGQHLLAHGRHRQRPRVGPDVRDRPPGPRPSARPRPGRPRIRGPPPRSAAPSPSAATPAASASSAATRTASSRMSGAPSAAQHLAGLAHLQGVPDAAPQRLRHGGHGPADAPAPGLGERGHQLRGRAWPAPRRRRSRRPRPSRRARSRPRPPAIFLLMIDAAMSPAAGTVPVASRRA